MIATTCLVQSALAMMLDARYDHRLRRHLFEIIWYPFAYWTIGMLTTMVAFPKAMARGHKRGRWVSPDRGLA
jgi:biofilm PGA synthesis N-glycosyltransferase PgaC